MLTLCSVLNLIQHRFASHCCETLLTRAALFLRHDIRGDIDPQSPSSEQLSTLESHVRSVAETIEPHFGHLISNQFASHIIRLLLLILAGKPLSSNPRKTPPHEAEAQKTEPRKAQSRNVPVTLAFSSVLDRLMSIALNALDMESMRVLATEPHANPVIQILLSLEFEKAPTDSGSRSFPLFRRLFPDDSFLEDTDSAHFVHHLLFDVSGSRLLEVIMSQAPGKLFKQIYRTVFQDHLARLARNELAVFVIVKILQRLSGHDLELATEQLCPQLEELFQKSRHVVVKTLVEQVRLRQLGVQRVAESLRQSANGDHSKFLIRLGMETTEDPDKHPELPTPSLQQRKEEVGKTHSAILAQTLLAEPDECRQVVNEALLTLEAAELLINTKSKTSSRIIQSALTCKAQDIAFKRPFTLKLIEIVMEMAGDPVASHVVDALWDGTSSLKFVREQAAKKLLDNEHLLHQSVPGRAVWRNWKMDLFSRRRGEWLHGTTSTPATKSSIELARDRHLARSNGQKNVSRKFGNISANASATKVV